MLLGIIGILAWGLGFIPQSAWACLEKDENLVEIIWANKITYAKLLKVAWGARHWTLKSNKCNQTKKWMQYPSIMISKLFMGGIFPYFYFIYFNIVCILTLESILFFCVRFQGMTKEAFVVDAIRLALEHRQLFTHYHVAKAIKVATKYRTNMGIASSSSSSEE